MGIISIIFIIAAIFIFIFSKNISRLFSEKINMPLVPSVIRFISIFALAIIIFLNIASRNAEERDKRLAKEQENFEKELVQKREQEEKEKNEKLIEAVKEDSAYIANYNYKDKATTDIPTMKASIEYLERFLNGEYEDYNPLYRNDLRASIPLDYIKREVPKILKKAEPLYRKQFAKIMDDKLWEENIDVNITDTNNSTIWFIGGYFASNKNIKKFQEQIQDEVRLFGFKKTCYKWIKHTDEYTYYDLY